MPAQTTLHAHIFLPPLLLRRVARGVYRAVCVPMQHPPSKDSRDSRPQHSADHDERAIPDLQKASEKMSTPVCKPGHNTRRYA